MLQVNGAAARLVSAVAPLFGTWTVACQAAHSQGTEPVPLCLLHCEVDSLPLYYLGNPQEAVTQDLAENLQQKQR